MIPDHDLKRRLGFLHKEAIRKGLLVRIIKVRSHMNISLFSDKVEQWAFRGNDTADLCASRGLDILPSEFWDIWQQLGREIDDISTVRKHLHSLIVQIGQVAVQSKGQIREVDAQQWDDENRRENPVDDTSELSCRDLPPTFDFGRLVKVGYRTLGPMAPIVYQWLVELVSSPEGVSQWVNTYQLLIIFQQQPGHVGLREGFERSALSSDFWMGRWPGVRFFDGGWGFRYLFTSFAETSWNDFWIQEAKTVGHEFQRLDQLCPFEYPDCNRVWRWPLLSASSDCPSPRRAAQFESSSPGSPGRFLIQRLVRFLRLTRLGAPKLAEKGNLGWCKDW